MVKVQLPFSTLYICQICGQMNSSEELIAQCEAVLPWETTDVRVGDEVLVYQRVWRGKSFIGLSEMPEAWGVTTLRYAKPGERLSFSLPTSQQPKRHQLCIDLAQATEMPSGKTRACRWEEKDAKDIISWLSFTYAEFLLWREGDRQKLEQAGIVAS